VTQAEQSPRWHEKACLWAAHKLFGEWPGSYDLQPPVTLIGDIDLSEPEPFRRFMTGLPETLPPDATLAIYPPNAVLEDYRKLDVREAHFRGGWFAKPSSMFWLKPTAENIERICELQTLEPRFSRALNVHAFSEGMPVLDWTVMSNHLPTFSAHIDPALVRRLAGRCGGTVYGPRMSEQILDIVENRVIFRDGDAPLA